MGRGAPRGDAVGAPGLTGAEAGEAVGGPPDGAPSPDAAGLTNPAGSPDGQAPIDSPRAVLDRWEEHGAVWRVATLTPERAQVDLCACTGEPVDRLESVDPELIAYLRERPSSED